MKDGKLGMKFATMRNQGEAIHLKVDALNIPFEPSVYNGTGTETRKGIVFDITNSDAKSILVLEERLRQEMEIPLEKWNSCLRENGQTWRLKAKINMSGDRACLFADCDGKDLRGYAAVAVLSMNSVYSQRQASGLVLDVVALRRGAKMLPDPPVWMKSLGF